MGSTKAISAAWFALRMGRETDYARIIASGDAAVKAFRAGGDLEHDAPVIRKMVSNAP